MTAQVYRYMMRLISTWDYKEFISKSNMCIKSETTQNKHHADF